MMAGARAKNKYTADWPAIAAQVKADANYRCVRCGAASSVPNGTVLTVHHFDGDKANNFRHNLMALCQRCHLSVQARVDPATPLMFDPSTWAMPYLAGLYEFTGTERPGHTPPATYDLDRWIETYRCEAGDWPDWAPYCSNHMPATACGSAGGVKGNLR